MTVRRTATSPVGAIGVQRGRLSARLIIPALLMAGFLLALVMPTAAIAQPTPTSPAPAAAAAPQHEGGEANLILPDLSQVQFAGGWNGRTLLMSGLLVSLLGLGFGFMMANQLRNLPVHRSMLEISDLIAD